MNNTSQALINVHQLFKYLEIGQADQFYFYIADNVKWSVSSSPKNTTCYKNKNDFLNQTFRRLGQTLPDSRHEIVVNNIIIIKNWALVEMKLVTSKNKSRPVTSYERWVVKFARNNIVEVHAYLNANLIEQFAANRQTHDLTPRYN